MLRRLYAASKACGTEPHLSILPVPRSMAQGERLLDNRPNRWARGVVASAIACSLAAAQAPVAWAQPPAVKASAGGSASASATAGAPAAKPDLNAAKKHYGE